MKPRLFFSRFTLISFAFAFAIAACGKSGEGPDTSPDKTSTGDGSGSKTGCTKENTLCLLVPTKAEGTFSMLGGSVSVNGGIRHEYDAKGNVTKTETYFTGKPDQPALTVETQYDANNKISSQTIKSDLDVNGVVERTDTTTSVNHQPNFTLLNYSSTNIIPSLTPMTIMKIDYFDANGDLISQIYREDINAAPSLQRWVTYLYDSNRNLTGFNVKNNSQIPAGSGPLQFRTYEVGTMGYDSNNRLSSIGYKNYDCLKGVDCVNSPDDTILINTSDVTLYYNDQGDLDYFTLATDNDPSVNKGWDVTSECQVTYLDRSQKTLKFPEILEKLFKGSSHAASGLACADSNGLKTNLTVDWKPLWQAAGVAQPE